MFLTAFKRNIYMIVFFLKNKTTVSYMEKFQKWKENQNIEENKCNSSKIFALPCEKKARTVGLLMAVYNCGIISSFKEIFKQVYLFFLQIESFFNLLTFLGL